MTAHAEAHVQVDVALGDGLVRDVAVAGRARDLFSNVRRVVELDVRLLGVAVHALPRQIDTVFAHLRDALNPRLVGRNGVVAPHARAYARQPRYRAGQHAFMAVLRAGDLLVDVDDVREFKRLLLKEDDPL